MSAEASSATRTPRVLLEHRKSTAREGWGVVAALGIPLAGFLALVQLLRPGIERVDK